MKEKYAPYPYDGEVSRRKFCRVLSAAPVFALLPTTANAEMTPPDKIALATYEGTDRDLNIPGRMVVYREHENLYRGTGQLDFFDGPVHYDAELRLLGNGGVQIARTNTPNPCNFHGTLSGFDDGDEIWGYYGCQHFGSGHTFRAVVLSLEA